MPQVWSFFSKFPNANDICSKQPHVGGSKCTRGKAVKRLIAIKRSAAVNQYSQIMSCHVMSCLIRTVDVYNLGAWVLAVWGQTKWKRWVAGKRWRGNLDKTFPYSQGCSHNLEWKWMKFDANHIDGLEVSMTGYFKCIQCVCRPAPPQIHDFFQGLNWYLQSLRLTKVFLPTNLGKQLQLPSSLEFQ